MTTNFAVSSSHHTSTFAYSLCANLPRPWDTTTAQWPLAGQDTYGPWEAVDHTVTEAALQTSTFSTSSLPCLTSGPRILVREHPGCSTPPANNAVARLCCIPILLRSARLRAPAHAFKTWAWSTTCYYTSTNPRSSWTRPPLSSTSLSMPYVNWCLSVCTSF